VVAKSGKKDLDKEVSINNRTTSIVEKEKEELKLNKMQK